MPRAPAHGSPCPAQRYDARVIEFEFESDVARWIDEHGNPGSWYFATLPQELSDEVRALTRGMKGGFGSVKVQVRIGATEWSTSLFPSSAGGEYVLPIKRAVRDAEGLDDGDEATISIVV